MHQPIFDIDVPGMQATVNSYKPGSGLTWQQLFPLKYTPKFDLKGLEANEGIPVTADRVAFNVKAPIKSRQKVGSWSGHLGKISVSREKDELQCNEYEDLKVLSAANTEDASTARYLVDLCYDDVDFCNKAMDYRIELDSLRIGCSGEAVYKSEIDGENATDDTINFNVPSTNFKGATKVWSNAGQADGLGDIIAAQKLIKDKGLATPRFAIMEQAAFVLLQAQESTAKRLYPQAKDLTLVTSDMITLESINSYMAKLGYPQILVIDTYVTIEKKDGKTETIKPWNPNVVTLSPTPQLGWTYYKPVPLVKNTEALQVQGKYYKLTVYSEVNPTKEVTLAEAYVQAALINRSSLVFLNTAATTWNGGAS